MIADQSGRIESATEYPASIAALLWRKKGCESVLPKGRAIKRESISQGLEPAERSFDFREINFADYARSQHTSIVGATETADALTECQAELVDAFKTVGKIAIRFESNST